MHKSIEEIIVTGSLSELTAEQRTTHYLQVCDALGLDHRMHPLEYIFLDNRNGGRDLVLYVLRNGTDQLRKLNGIKITKISKEVSDGVAIFTAEAVDKDGQTDISTGAVSILGKSGQDKANAIMAAETKAKRRVTLSISGCGLLDETEIADFNSKVTVTSPGIGVSAAPLPATPPVTPNVEGKEVFPATAAPFVPPVRDPRIDVYKLEVLQAGGMVPVPGKPIGMKWSKFVLMQVPGKQSIRDLSPEEWKVILDKLDEVRLKTGDKGVVLHIEETIAKV